jgi:hypothetical protein
VLDRLRRKLRKFHKKLWPKRHEIILPETGKGFDYLELSSSCRTQNEFNRLHIGLENICTPLEIAGFAKLAKSRASLEATRSWLQKHEKRTPELFQTPQQYGRHVISQYMIVYESRENEKHKKDLLIAFTGNARRLMMPISVFLQFLDSRSWDVVVLKKCPRNSYLLGLEAIADDFLGLTKSLERKLSPRQYRRTLTLGVSGGGFAAALAAIMIGAARGICVSGGVPRSGVTDWNPDVKDHGVDLRFVFAEQNPKDKDLAIAAAEFLGGRPHPIAGVRSHSVLAQLLEEKQLAKFLHEMLN